MKKNATLLTTAQFARQHEVNKRTLHYYDEIGLFSPNHKGENGYRYYDSSQSLDFEYIRMLKDVHMKIEEIAAYIHSPNDEDFMRIAESKEKEIDAEIKRLTRTRQILHQKKEQLHFCKQLEKQEIRIQDCKEERLAIIPFDFADDDLSDIFSMARKHWPMEQICMGIGGYLSIDKVLTRNFEVYDGIFSPALQDQPSLKYHILPRGRYLCGYQKGSWDTLPSMYEKLLRYAQEHHIALCGYAYEIGLNEFVIAKPEDYITQIMIKIKEEN